MSTEQHTITVAVSEDSDDVDLTINHAGECPHTWWECNPCPAPPPEGEDAYDWYDVAPRHGRWHQHIDGWCVETTQCYMTSILDVHGFDDVPTQSGTYLLDFEGGSIDDSYLILGELVADR